MHPAPAREHTSPTTKSPLGLRVATPRRRRQRIWKFRSPARTHDAGVEDQLREVKRGAKQPARDIGGPRAPRPAAAPGGRTRAARPPAAAPQCACAGSRGPRAAASGWFWSRRRPGATPGTEDATAAPQPGLGCCLSRSPVGAGASIRHSAPAENDPQKKEALSRLAGPGRAAAGRREGTRRRPGGPAPAAARRGLAFRAREKCVACQRKDDGVCRQMLRNLRPRRGVVALNVKALVWPVSQKRHVVRARCFDRLSQSLQAVRSQSDPV